jgi:antirestriction protein ArdC
MEDSTMEKKDKKKPLDILMDDIIAEMEKGECAWIKPFTVGGGLPIRHKSQKPYRGMNIFLLLCKGFEDPNWIGYKELNKLGGTIKKDEDGKSLPATRIVHFSRWEWTDDKGKKQWKPSMQYLNVWNLEQTDGIESPYKRPEPLTEIQTLAKADELLSLYKDIPKIKVGNKGAYYSPSEDIIGMPKKDQFTDAFGYHDTLFHEAVHSTGHPTRCKRKLEAMCNSKKSYSFEELIAELGSAILCLKSGISKPLIENQSAYIKSWLKVFKADKGMLFKAGTQASKAVDYMTGVVWENNK